MARSRIHKVSAEGNRESSITFKRARGAGKLQSSGKEKKPLAFAEGPLDLPA
jgi:hypothetical protein